MSRRTFLAAVAVFSVIVFLSLYAVFPISAQTNSAPQFSAETATRNVDENAPSFHNIGEPVTATDSDDNRLVYTLENARTSPFTIVRATGQLQVGSPLDHETTSTYPVTVLVTDRKDANGNIDDSADDTITVTINVDDVEEPGKVSLSWTKPQVGAPITATLTDPDGGVSDTTWLWAISNSQNGPYTDLSGNGAGSATYEPQPDDARKYLRATATYTDVRGANKTAHSAPGFVQAVPNPNPAPDFRVDTSGGYSCDGFEGETADVCLHVKRNAPAGSDIYYPASVYYPEGAPQKDNDQVRYSLDGADAALFRIGPLSRYLYTTKAHGYDDPGEDGKFEITITATDPSGKSDNINVALRPSGSPGAPVVKGPESIVYPENGTWSLATYSATASNSDGDIRGIYGWIIAVQPGGGDGDFFDIDRDGNLTFTQPPDYEDPADDNGDNKYSFSLHVYDTNPPNRGRPVQTYFNVSVTVTNETVEALEIRGPSAVDYAEDRTDAVAIYELHGTSPPVEWSLSGADGGEFSIDADGVLTFDRQPDYENPTDAAEENAYLVTITAYAGEQSKTEFVRVRVTDVNEPPAFDEGETAIREVRHDAQLNSLIGEPVPATDPDKGASLTYTLPDAGTLPFSISEYTGQLSVSGTLAQNRPGYTVVVLVTDGEDADGNIDDSEDDRITVTINVAGAGNDAPEFPSTETGARSFPENTTGVQNVGVPVAATDADNDTLTYTLSGTDSGSFTIVGTSGQIQTKSGGTYDHEAKASYSVTVTADDDNGSTADQDVTITVTNLEEPGTVTLSTYQPSARSAVTAALSDPDKGVTGTTWQWAKSSDGRTGWSNVGTNSNTYTPPDGDLGSFLRATASYTDGQGPNKTANAVTTHAVQSGTNRAPEFDAATPALEVPENTGGGVNIGSPVTATDADNDPLTYSLDTTGAASFHIVPTSGQIQTKSGVTYDHEASNSYSVTVKADDSNGGTDTIGVTITVTDANEPPVITGPSSKDYPENGTDGVATYTATDPDGTTVTFELAGLDASKFRIANPDAGPGLTAGDIAFDTPPDYETPTDSNGDNVYGVTIRSSSGGQAEELDITVTVTNVNEPPEFPSTETGARRIPENTAAGQNIGDPVEAEDPDDGDTLTYALGGTDAESFDIDTSNGQLQTKNPLDYDTKGSYTVTVSVRDRNTDANPDDTITVTITVTDANEPPEITGESSINYAENDTVDVDIYTADDPDGTPTTFTWTLSGDDADDFSITGGVLRFDPAPNYEAAADKDTNNVYLVTVEASDEAVKGSLDVTVTVTNVNEPPAFDANAATRSIAENTAADQFIGDPIEADDPERDALVYALGGTGADYFDIDTPTGQLKTKAPLDKETEASYSVIVSVKDGKNDEGASEPTEDPDTTITVTITVTDANDPPTFSGTATEVRDIHENSSPNTHVGNPVTATDTDTRDTLTYTLEGTDKDSFQIVSTTGQILTKSGVTYNYEDKSSYSVTVKADDSNGGTATKPVTINLTDVNEPPAFDGTTTTREVPENTVANTNIGDPVEAEEPDDGDTLTYALVGTDATSFDIDASTGQLQTKSTLDKETKATYEVTVSVKDGKDANGDPNANEGTDATITVTITVTNVNETPEIAGGLASVEYAENETGPVQTYTATDPDDGVNVIWSLSGADSRVFSITGGVLTFKGPPDYEEPEDVGIDNVYSVTVTASDGRLSDMVDVTITVTNEEEPGKVTLSSLQPQALTGLVATLTDPDIIDSYDTWLWQLSSDQAPWTTISGATTGTYTPVDADVGKHLKVTVTYTDRHSSGKTAQVVSANQVQAAPQSNVAPVFHAGSATRTIAENTAKGENIGALVSATDDNNDTLTYSLSGTGAESFDIVRASGQLRTKDPLDYETKSSYTVIVTAADPSGSTATKDVTITVTNIDEPGTVTLSTNQPSARAAVTATLTDPDGSVTGTSWQWAKSRDGSNGWTNVGTDSSSYTPADVDVGDYLRATASYNDGEGNGKTAHETTTQPVRAGTNRAPDIPTTETGTRSFPENTPDGENIGDPVTATDLDNDTLNYTLEGTDKDSFHIVPTSGQIQTKSGVTYDHEGTKVSYSVTVKADDGKGGSDTIDVTIAVTDVNEAPTVNGPSTESHPENNSGTVATYTATDPERAVTSFTWTLSGDDAGDFLITGGVLTFDPTPNYEAAADDGTDNVYLVTVEASDMVEKGSLDVTVTVTNVNERPAFDPNAATRSIAENTAAGQPIGDPVEADDPERDALVYALGGTDADSFDIDTSTGQLNTKAPLDKENEASYSVIVSVKDGKNDEGASEPTEDPDTTITVTITVTNEDETPTVTGQSSINYAENRVDAVAIYTASDPESGSITWSLTGDDGGDFSISNTGELTFRETPNFEAPADADANNVYVVMVQASDGTNTVTEDLTVTVTDVNEPPEFDDGGTTTRSIAENTAPGRNIGEPVAANDPDTDAELTYSLSGTDAPSFTIDESTGQIKVGAGTTLDHEATKSSYTFTVSVSDGSPDTSADDTITVTITVTNVNEAPEAEGTAARDYAENGDEPVATYTARDPDGESIIWSLSGDDSSVFSITEGVLTFKDSPDFEEPEDADTDDADTDNVYNVTVIASDGRLSDTVDVTITVTNMEELGKVTLNLLQPQVDTGLTTIVTDPDGGVRGMTWLWQSSSDKSTWTPISGAVSGTYIPVDADVGKHLKVTVTYTDRHSSGKTARAVSEYAVQAAPVSNDPPEFSKETDTRTVPENTGTGQNVGDPVTAIDPNTDTLTYSLGGTDAGSFDIVQASGQLLTKAALDYEDNNSYTVTVTVTDPSGESDTISVTITVTDVNDAPEFPAAETGARTIAENTPAGRNIGGPVTATDEDGNTLNYTLGGADAASFNIDASTGQLQTKGALDYETKTSYTVTVTASDGSLSDTQDVTITVTEENETPEVTGDTTISYAENREDTVAEYTATDPEGESIIWFLSGDDSSVFSITGGVLTFKESPDFEGPADADPDNEYNVTVTASDGSLSGEVDVTITVTNVDEPGVVTLNLLQPQVATGLTTIVTDPDGGVLGMTWLWESSSDKNTWTPISSGAVSGTYIPVAADVGNYLRVTVTYTDGHDSGKTAQVVSEMPVQAETSSNVAPAFDAGTATRTIAENTDADQHVGSPVQATDTDDDTLTYSLGGSDAGSFDIDQATGQLQTKAPLDHETKDTHTVTVTATDPSGESDTISVTITVTDINDAPAFAADTAIRTIPENTAADTNIGDPVTAPDEDDDTPTYTLGGTDAASFGIVPASGQLQTKAPLDHETKDTYTVDVTATDPSGASDTIPVTITVTDQDEAPEVTSQFIYYAEKGTGPVTTYTATDPDSDTIIWSLSGADSTLFSISNSGELTFRNTPDYEAPEDSDTDNIYLVTVEVYGQTQTNPVPVTVTVTNVNEPPAFAAATNTRSVAENTPAGQNIGLPVEATDPDAGDNLTYSLSGADAASFDIDSSTGQLKTKAALDYETGTSYTVTVTAADRFGLSDAITVTITVTNVEEDGTVVLLPLQPQVNTELTATLTNPDGGISDATWLWESSPDGNTGWITIGGATDRYTPATADVGKYLRATASYTDLLGTTKSAQAVTTHAVRAVPSTNSAPEFPATETGTRSVAENTLAGENIGDPVAAADPDTADTLTYTLEGTDAASFSIVPESGQLKTKTDLDHETKPSYTVIVRVTDPSGLSDTITVTITVTNRDEEGTVTLSSVQPQVDTELTATLEDPDGVTSGSTAWQWANSTGNSEWIPISGANSAESYTPVAEDMGKYLRATASYIDGEGSGKTARAQSTNVVEAAPPPPQPPPPSAPPPPQPPPPSAPIFSGETITRTVPENTTAGENIGAPVTATDPNDDTLAYTLGGTDAESFAIVETSGQLQTKAALDYENKSTYMVTVTATDSSNGSGMVTVTINVTNMDEDGTVALSSKHPRAGTELTATLTDSDGDVSDTTWKWQSSADKSAWTDIGGATTTTYTPVDADVGRYLRATASYTDGEGPGKTAQAVSSNAVLAPGANSPPEFPATEPRTRSVVENTPAGQNIGDTVTASDADDDVLTYSLGGDDADSFSLDASTGQLKTKAALDYETKNSYSVTVSVRDSKDADGAADTATDDTIELTVTVTDVVKEPPGRPAAPTVEAVSTRSLSVTWTEPDNTGPTISGYDVEYRVKSSDGAFTMKTTSGGSHSLFISGLSPGTSYEVQVRAENVDGPGEWSALGTGSTKRVVSGSRSRGDGGGWTRASASTSATSNRPPVFTEGESTQRWVAEQTAAETNIGPPVAAIDPDDEPLTYSLSGFTGSLFTMNRHSGQLKTKVALDSEVQPSYTGVVNVSDGRGGSDAIVLTITVLEVRPLVSPSPSPTTTPVAMGVPTATPTPTPTPTATPTPTPTATPQPTVTPTTEPPEVLVVAPAGPPASPDVPAPAPEESPAATTPTGIGALIVGITLWFERLPAWLLLLLVLIIASGIFMLLRWHYLRDNETGRFMQDPFVRPMRLGPLPVMVRPPRWDDISDGEPD